MFPPLRTTSASAVAALLAGCANVSVTTDYDRTADFSKYHTYAFAPAAPGDQQSVSSLQEAIRRAVNSGLTAKGLTLSAAPGLIVSTRFVTKDQIAVHRHTDWGGAGSWPGVRSTAGNHGFWPETSHNMTDIDRFTEGTVLLDFVDAKTQRRIWRGEGAIVFGTAAENARNAEDAVTRLLARFPPKQRRAN